MGYQPLGETEAERLLGFHRVSHRDLHRLAFADPAREADDTAVVRQYPQGDLGQTPLRTIGSDNQIAAISDDAADTDRIPVDCSYDRLGKLGQHLACRAMPLRQALDEFGDRALSMGPRVLEIGAGRERAA